MKPVARGYASDKTGLPPGSLVHVGQVLETETTVSVIDYSRDGFAEPGFTSVDQLLPFRDSGTVTWVIAEGLADVGYFPEHPTVLLLYFRRKKWL